MIIYWFLLPRISFSDYKIYIVQVQLITVVHARKLCISQFVFNCINLNRPLHILGFEMQYAQILLSPLDLCIICFVFVLLQMELSNINNAMKCQNMTNGLGANMSNCFLALGKAGKQETVDEQKSSKIKNLFLQVPTLDPADWDEEHYFEVLNDVDYDNLSFDADNYLTYEGEGFPYGEIKKIRQIILEHRDNKVREAQHKLKEYYNT